jgi:UDP-N-acetylmuramyl pentapeptide phosphotransferase/UDP-N-acetylglucosamine-1-phosphate transferase
MDITLGLEYILFTAIMAFLENIYILLAPEIGIIDKPNARSSHRAATIRGGGIIFWFAALIYFIFTSGEHGYFLIGATIIAAASFADDIRPIHQLPRFIMHFAALTSVFISSGIFAAVPWYVIPVAYLILIGILNAYNFMDGINGITGLYSISLLLTLQWINLKIVVFADPALIWVPILANLVFLYFNYRKRAICFAGDVGSVTMAFWIVYLILLLMIKSGTVTWIFLLAVYGTDSVLTIIHRIYLRQNIFAAHRLHFYQILANEKGLDHRIISLGYAIAQGLISGLAIWQRNMPVYILFPLIIIPLILIYLLKFSMISNSKHSSF